MSLIAWYPLIKDGKNQGLDGVDLTTIGTITYSAGKLGNAATFVQDLSSRFRRPQIKINDNFSFACWFKLDTTTSTTWQTLLFEGRDVNSDGWGFRINGSTKRLIYCCGSSSWTYGTDLIVGQWYHAVMVVDNGVYTAYLNGAQVSTGPITTLPTLTEWGTYFYVSCLSDNYYPLMGQVQDVRIYDHVLSKREVKELSKGLCLHIPLNWGGNPNLLSKSNNQFYFDYTTTTANTVLFWQSANMALESGVSYTVSFDAKIDSTDNTLRQGIEVDLYPDALPQKNYKHRDENSISNQWKHFTWTTSSTNSNITSCSLRFFCDMLDSTSNLKVMAPIHVKNIKLEKGTTDTPYVPPSSSPDYTKYGLNTKCIEDCSGYNHAATVTGTAVSCSAGSPRGTGTNWNGAYKVVYADGMPVGTNPLFTINFWIKTKPDTTQTRYADVCLMTSQNNAGTTQSTRMELENTTGSNLLWHGINAHNLITSNAITPGTWYMQTFVSDGSKVIAYRNGTQIGTFNYTDSSYINWKTLGSIQLGDTTAVYYDLADFRVYATALSADDIKALYSIAAEIDKSGKVYCSNLMET